VLNEFHGHFFPLTFYVVQLQISLASAFSQTSLQALREVKRALEKGFLTLKYPNTKRPQTAISSQTASGEDFGGLVKLILKTTKVI
jgi:hypothetical protein